MGKSLTALSLSALVYEVGVQQVSLKEPVRVYEMAKTETWLEQTFCKGHSPLSYEKCAAVIAVLGSHAPLRGCVTCQ